MDAEFINAMDDPELVMINAQIAEEVGDQDLMEFAQNEIAVQGEADA